MISMVPAAAATEWLFKDFYHTMMLPLFVVTVWLAWLARPSSDEPLPEGFSRFRLRYLVGWCLCVAADWLQGPYVYALYSAYGYSRAENAQLFVAGFGSSMVTGCFVGSLIDRFGRKRSALAYCLLYILSCATKHFNVYPVLMLGRILGGAATSLLFSCFECWMVSEHKGRHKFSDGLLSYMFGTMFMLMYVCAIASGVVAQIVADHFVFAPIADGSKIHVGGATAPFDVASLLLMVGAVHIIASWDENYGSSGGDARSFFGMLAETREVFARNPNVFFVGAIVSCFEGSMFAFVFNWTPALEDSKTPAPLGLIFSAFMMACMCGSSLSTVASNHCSPQTCLKAVCVFGVLAFFLIVLATAKRTLPLIFCGFLLFELAVGTYFPTVGFIKSEVVPEAIRGTVYNIYRVPLNAIVIGLLLTNMSLLQCYVLCASLLLVAFISSNMISLGKAGKTSSDSLINADKHA